MPTEWIDTHFHIHAAAFQLDGGDLSLQEGIGGLIDHLDDNDVGKALLTMYPLSPSNVDLYPGTDEFFHELALDPHRRIGGIILGGRDLNQCLLEYESAVNTAGGTLNPRLVLLWKNRLRVAFDDIVDKYGKNGTEGETLVGIGELAILHVSTGDTPYMEIDPESELLWYLLELVADYQETNDVTLPISIHCEVVHPDMANVVTAFNPVTGVSSSMLDMERRWGDLQAHDPTLCDFSDTANPWYIGVNWHGFIEFLRYAKELGVKIVWEHLGQSMTGVEGDWLRNELDRLWTPTVAMGEGLMDTLYMSLKIGESDLFQTDFEGLVGEVYGLAPPGQPLPISYRLVYEWGSFIAEHQDNLVLGSDDFYGMTDVITHLPVPRDLQDNLNQLRTLFISGIAEQLGEETPGNLFGVTLGIQAIPHGQGIHLP
jgi:hypothetical protein